MATANTEISSVENMTKQEMAKIIKTAKKESERQGKKTATSICDTMKDNTSEIIQKIESKFPVYAELYTALYTKYLHTIEDLYGVCYISEKEFFNNVESDNAASQAFGAYLKFMTNMATTQIDVTMNFLQMYVQMRIATIESYDMMTHLMIDSYMRAWNQFKPKR